MGWVVKITESNGQYRVTLPRELVEKSGFDDVGYVTLSRYPGIGIMIEEYHGKDKEKRDVPEDRA